VLVRRSSALAEEEESSKKEETMNECEWNQDPMPIYSTLAGWLGARPQITVKLQQADEGLGTSTRKVPHA
jgi:hypothetical protein